MGKSEKITAIQVKEIEKLLSEFRRYSFYSPKKNGKKGLGLKMSLQEKVIKCGEYYPGELPIKGDRIIKKSEATRMDLFGDCSNTASALYRVYSALRLPVKIG